MRTFSGVPPQNHHATADSEDNRSPPLSAAFYFTGRGKAFSWKVNFGVRLPRDPMGSDKGEWKRSRGGGSRGHHRLEGFSLLDPMLLKHQMDKGIKLN